MIVKQTSSGKAWLLVDDFGNSYVLPQAALAALKAGTNKAPFAIAKRLPTPQPLDQWRPSPLLGKDWEEILEGMDAWVSPQCPHNVVVGDRRDGGLSKASISRREDKKRFMDVKL